MPVYLSDQPDITADVLDLRRRLSILENNQSSGGTTTSTTTIISGGGGGGGVPPGGWTYSQLGSDVTTTFDSRYVNVTGDSMSGSLTIGGTLGVTSNTTLGGSLDVATNLSVSGNTTIHGGLLTYDAQNATFEIGSVGISNAPKIDFHSSLAGSDYDVRLAASGGTGTPGNGALTILAGTIAIPTISNAVTMNSSLHTLGSITDDGVLYVTGQSTLAAGVLAVSATGGGGGADPYPGSSDYPASSYYPSVGGLGAGIGSAVVTGTFQVTDTSLLAGDVTFGAGIVASTFGQTDNSYFAWDAGSKRFGFSKKSGVMGKLAYANGTFAITQYVGQTSIIATNTQTDRLTIDVSGTMTVPGAVSFGSTLGVTGIATFTAAVALPSGISTKDIITGGGGAGIGNIGSATIDTYNIKDAAVTSAKLSPGALSSAAAPAGTANNQRGRLTRYVTASPSTQDAAGQNLDNLRIPGTTGIATARTSDSQAYGSNAIKVTAASFTATTGSMVMDGIFYGSNANDYTNSPGLPGGQYRVTVYVKASSVASSLPVIAFDSHDATAGTVLNDGTLYTFKASELSTFYVGCSFPLYVQADTQGTNGLEVRAYYFTGSGANISISHVQIEPWSGLTQQEVDATYIKDATITNAKIHDLQADKITTGTLTADITQSGIIRTGPDSGARLVLNSGGLYAYSDATTNTVQILANGTASFTGTVNATGGTFTGVVSGGTFRGGTFETASGTVSAVRFDSTGIKGWDSGGINTFSLLTSGALTATNATITGAINATSGTFTGTLYGVSIAGGIIKSTASVDSRNPEGINGTTDWHDISDGPTATITQQTSTGWGGAGNAIRFAYIATTAQVPAPSFTSATANVGGGTFAAGTYFWVITATNALGETTKSNERSAAILLNGTASLVWASASGATGYKVYRGTATNSENVLVATLGNVTSYTDTGSAGTGGSPPGTNTTSNARTFNVPAHFPFASAGLISSGQLITLSFYGRVISGDGVITPYIAHGDSTNVLLAQQGNITLTGSWVRYTRTGTALMISDTSHEVLFPRPNMQSAGTIEITGIQIEPGPSATTYGNGQQRMEFDQAGLRAYDNAGSIVTQITTSNGRLTANNITANSGTFSGSISAAGMTLTGGTFSTTSIQASTIDATNNINAGSLTSGTLSTARISVASGFSEDLILNGGFEDAVALASWTQQYETAGTAISFSVGTSNVFSGANRAEVSLATNQGTSQASSSVPVSAGDTYSIRGRMRAEGTNPTTGKFYVRVLFGTAKDFVRGSVVGTTPSHTTIAPAGHSGADSAGFSDIVSNLSIAASTWVLFEGSVVVPTGATWMRVATYAWSNATGAWVGAFDEIVVRRQVTGTVIADGSITTNSMTANTISGDRITANTLSASKISTGTLNAATLITVGTAGGARVEIDGNTSTGGIRLFNSSSATTVSLVSGTGSASFTGTVNATGGTFSGSITVTGSISGGTISSNASGLRVVLGGGSGDAISFYNSSSVTQPGKIIVYADTTTSSGLNITDGTFSSSLLLTSTYIQVNQPTNVSVNTSNFTVSGNGSNNTQIQLGSSINNSNATYYANHHDFHGYTNSLNGAYDSGNRVWSAAYFSGTISGNLQATGYLQANNGVYSADHYDGNNLKCIGTGGTSGGAFTRDSGGGYVHVNCSHGFTVQIRDFSDSNWETVQALSFSTMSSAELKENVTESPHGLATVRNLRPVTYNLRDPENDAQYVGLIAEEVEEHLPEIISRGNKHDLPGIDYGAMVSVLVSAVQELAAKVDALEERVS